MMLSKALALKAGANRHPIKSAFAGFGKDEIFIQN